MLCARAQFFRVIPQFRFATAQGQLDKFAPLKDYVLNYHPVDNPILDEINFEKDVAPALRIYKELGFNKNHLSRLWKLSPTTLTLNKDQNDIQRLSQFLKEQIDLSPRQLRAVLFKEPNLLRTSNEQIGQYINLLRDELKVNNEGIQRILFFYPLFMNEEIVHCVKRLKQILNTFAAMNDEQVGQLSVKFPYIFGLDQELLETNLKIISYYRFKSQEIQTILNSTCEFLTHGAKYFELGLNTFVSIIQDRKKLKEVIVKHPRLLDQCPHSMVATKINAFLSLGFDHEQIGQILYLYPQIFLKSTGSMRLKLAYLKKYFKFNPQEEMFFPQILTHKYWEEIRPRGELLKIKDVKFDWQQVLELSNQEFLNKYDFNQEQLDKLLSEKPNNLDELDYRKKFFTRYFKNSSRYVSK